MNTTRLIVVLTLMAALVNAVLAMTQDSKDGNDIGLTSHPFNGANHGGFEFRHARGQQTCRLKVQFRRQGARVSDSPTVACGGGMGQRLVAVVDGVWWRIRLAHPNTSGERYFRWASDNPVYVIWRDAAGIELEDWEVHFKAEASRTESKATQESRDWHFRLRLAGSIGVALALAIASIVADINKAKKQQNAGTVLDNLLGKVAGDNAAETALMHEMLKRWIRSEDHLRAGDGAEFSRDEKKVLFRRARQQFVEAHDQRCAELNEIGDKVNRD